jgi:hypothetical protein
MDLQYVLAPLHKATSSLLEASFEWLLGIINLLDP